MNIEIIADILLKTALGLYLISVISLLFKKYTVGNILFGGGWLSNLCLFFTNGIAAKAPPFGNMYHVLIFLALCMAPIFFIVAKKFKLTWLAPHFSIVAIISITGPLFMDRDIFWSRMPALQSPWFVPHVFAYMISYALAAVAFAITIGDFFSKNKENDQASYLILLIAYPFMTFGMLSGALWAEEAWGSYWSWDAKETWALITWGAYLIYFHTRLSPQLKHYAKLAQLVGFIALLITFLVVNLLPKMGSLLHSYA